jgi:hypothetical protein
VPEGGEPYLTAVAALRAVYDIVDSVKCWEQQQAQRGEQAFELVVEQLHKEYDLIGIDRGRRPAATEGKAATTK